MPENYQFPISAATLYNGKKLPKYTTEESVRKHIYLILMTNLREYGFDTRYGNALWDNDFDVSINESNWNDRIVNVLKEDISNAEPRIDKTFEIEAKVVKYDIDDHDTKQKFIITISKMALTETNEKINDIEYVIVFSPISIS